TTREGAQRETIEEAGADIELEDLFTVLSVPRVGQVHLFYRARLLSDRFDPGHETIETRLFSENEIPWDEIAFRTVKQTLEHFFADRRSGRFGVHAGDIS
ncbi:MAG: hypothetical protein RJA10_2749, partial [Pseudomonadota bacterium]